MSGPKEVTEQAWMADAECLGMDPDIFFPERGSTAQAAKAVCARCPVVDECLEMALENKEVAGVFGGKTADDRKKLSAARRRWGLGATPDACPQGHKFDETNVPKPRSDGYGLRCPKCRKEQDRRRGSRRARLSIVKDR